MVEAHWSALLCLEAGPRCAQGGRIDFLKIVLSEKTKAKEREQYHSQCETHTVTVNGPEYFAKMLYSFRKLDQWP